MRILKYRKTDRTNAKNRARHAAKVERITMPVTRGDTVRVLRGEDKGKEGKVLRVFSKTGRVTIEGINIVKKHRKARRAEEQSGIIEMSWFNPRGEIRRGIFVSIFESGRASAYAQFLPSGRRR